MSGSEACRIVVEVERSSSEGSVRYRVEVTSKFGAESAAKRILAELEGRDQEKS